MNRAQFDKRICRFGMATTGVALALASAACSSKESGRNGGVHGDAGSPADAQSPAALASDAFVWGFPLVVSERTLQTLGALVGVDKLFNQTALSTAAIRFIVSPNQDTLYSIAVLDLRSEPMVLEVPDVADRYWTYQFLDAWTNSFHYLGTRATLGKGGKFAITPPGFQGSLPADTTEIASPTRELFLLGRYLVRDPADAANVSALNRTLVPLSTATGAAPPPGPPPLGMAPGTPQEVGSNGAAFFDELGDALSANPPASEVDRRELARFQSLGIGPGQHPSQSGGAAAVALLAGGTTDGMRRVDEAASGVSTEVNGWTVHLDIGTYSTDLLLRAAVAKLAWGANVPEEAVYPVSARDGSGAAYSGDKRYVMHFDAGKLPPVDATHGFWSLTLYGPDRFFVENSIQRYAIGDRTPGLTYNPDGSLDLYVQNATPAGKEGNWLPAPAGGFSLMLRLYLPTDAVLKGTYEYPPVVVEP